MLCNQCYYPMRKSIVAQGYTHGGKVQLEINLDDFFPRRYHLRKN